jgi:acyl-CoA synthetase (AMP-forming)/AMP-acid ligase II
VTAIRRPSSFSTAEEILSNRARREPLGPAIGWGERMVLLGRFAELVAERAEAIARLVRPGGAIAQIMSDTPAAVGTTLSIWRAGCTAVPLDHRLSPQQIGRRLAHSSVRAVIAHEEHLERAQQATASASGALVLVARGLRLLPAGAASRERRSGAGRRLVPLPGPWREGRTRSRGRSHTVNEIAFHAYTGQPEGPPRAAVITHANVVASALRTSIARGDASGDVSLASHPCSDVSALVGEVLSRMIVGGAVVLLGPGGLEALAERVDQHRITDLSLASDIAAELAEAGGLPRRIARSVRKLVLRDPTLPLTVKRGLLDGFARSELVQSHGCVEATDAIATAREGTVFRKPDSLGTPHPGLVVAVVDPEGRTVRAGQRGEIVCRGAVVMRGYHRRLGMTREALRQGWLHTGDMGYIDADGELGLIKRRTA